jgi:hypothetical protein
MIGLITGLASLAPAAIRLLASARGGRTAEIGETVAKLVEATSGLSTEARGSVIEKQLEGLSPESAAALMTLEAEAKQAIEVEREKSWQIQLQTEGQKAKQVRPTIAIQSWWTTIAYSLSTLILFPLLSSITPMEVNPTFSLTVFGALFTPAGAFMGIRGVERWKAGGTPS